MAKHKHDHEIVSPVIPQVVQNLNNPIIETPKMGIHLLTNASWAASGYGVQARLFALRIKALGYPVSMTAFYGLQGHTLNMDGMVIFPCGYHPYGLDVAPYNTAASGADILLTNMDAWVCDPPALAMTRWVPWFPVDSEPIPKAVETRVRTAFDRIVYTHFACGECDKVKLDYHYVPMGVDTKALFPIARADAFANLNGHIPAKLDPDKFMVSMVAMNKGNPSRKAFYQQIRAFKELHDHHPDTLLYLHTQRGEQSELGGVNLPEFIKSLGLEKDVFFPDQKVMINGYPDDFMNAIYNSSDVLMSVSMGEGFGLPIVEAQAAGCPVIVGDWTSMPELLFAGWKVEKKDAQPWFTFLNSYMFDPHWQAVYEQLELAYAARGNQELRAQARAGAQAYDADLITETYWKPVLEKINEKVQANKKELAIAAVPQAYEPNDTLLIQQVSKNYSGANMLGLTYARNVDYCLKHKIDYQTIIADIDKFDARRPGEVGWGKVSIIRQAMDVKHYKNIFYLDADTIIADTNIDLRDACIPDKVGAVWHDLNQGGQILGHYNVGVLAFSNTEKTRKFVEEWLAQFPGTTEFPWWEQGVFNRLGAEQNIINRLDAAWNSVNYVNSCPHPVILGFHGFPDRYNAMKEALAKLEKEQDDG
jgi:glycosyltransferase involved in cell wall biosynthesis